ncbi:MAG: hypothetical protein ABFD52_00675 [Acidobacteriota bacterium]
MERSKGTAEATPFRLQFESEGGALIKVGQSRRTVKCFGVTEEELDHLSLLNTLSTIFFSLASGSLFFSISLLLELFKRTTQDPATRELVFTVSPFTGVVGLAFLGIAIYTLKKRGSAVTRIKEQSEIVP